jgi:hypothetical protein
MRSDKLRLAILGLTVFAAIGCGDDPPKKQPSATAATSVAKSAPPASAAKSDQMPSVTVDNMGPYIAGERAKLKEPGGPEKLKGIIAGLPIKGKEVTLVVLKKSTVPDVLAVVRELGAAGAPTVKIKTDGRDDLPKELVVVPQSRLTDKVPACSVVAMVSEDLSASIWPIAGGGGRKHSKGFAGPDLSNTGATAEKDIEKCDSTTAFFSADEGLEWELAHNVGGTLTKADVKKKISRLVLLDPVPVPGRPVKGLP